MKLLKFLFLALCAVVTFSCTSDEPSDPDSGQEISPDEKVPDPTGTVLLSMRDKNNGDTALDEIGIANENFHGSYTSFVDLGPVNGLGNVTTIPKEGWASQVKVIPGHGYVAYTRGWEYYGPYAPECYRIYVVDYIYSISGGIIGADIKYQKTFRGLDQDLIFDKTEMICNLSKFPYSSYSYGKYTNSVGFNHKILNDSYTYYTVHNPENNHILYNYGSINFNSFYIYNVTISRDLFNSVLSSSEPLVEIDSLTVTTGYGKTKSIKVFIDRTK